MQTRFGDAFGTATVDELREAAKHLYKQPRQFDPNFHVVYNALEQTIEGIQANLPLIVSLADLDPTPQVCFGRRLLLNWQECCTAWLGEWRLLLLFHALSKKLFFKFKIGSEQYGHSPALASAMRRAFGFRSEDFVRQLDEAYAESQKHGPHFAADCVEVHAICRLFERGNSLGLYSPALLGQYPFVVALLTHSPGQIV